MPDAVENELRRLRAAGHTQESASMALGIDRNKLRRLLAAHSVPWPRRPPIKTLFRGRMRTLREIAGGAGLPPKLVSQRYWQGKRGEALVAPQARRTGTPRRRSNE